MFDDPQVVIGMVIGLILIIGGAALGVMGHRHDRDESENEHRL